MMSMEELGIVNDMPKGWKSGKFQPSWHRKAYNMWFSMHSRVKDPTNISYKYYKDSKILEDYNYLSNYVRFLESQPNFQEFCNTCDKIRWSVDKDMKCPGNKNYYPEFMTLCTTSDNSIDACSRKPYWHGKDARKRASQSQKKPVIGVGISNNSILLFKCINDTKDRGFTQSNVSNALKGRQKSHRGYRWYYVNYKHNKILRKVI